MRVLLVLAVALTLFCACEDPTEEDAGPADSGVSNVDTGVLSDSGPPRDTGLPDSGPADVLLADGAMTMDATPGDADPTDGMAGDGGPRTGPLTLIFEPFSAFGASGVAIFQDATGALQRTRTTTVGLIVETIEEGWMVTLANSLDNPYALFTITEVAPNETYRVAALVEPAAIATMYFTIGDPYPGASSYWIESGCYGPRLVSGPSVIAAALITDECTSAAGLFDYAAVARDSNLDRLAFRLIEDVPVVANSTVTFVDPWRTDFSRLAIDVSNAPIGADYLRVEAAVRSNGAEYDYDSDNLVFSAGGGTYTLVRPPFGEGIDSRYSIIGPNDLSWLQKTAGAPIDQTYDLSVDFLPFPGPVTLAATAVSGRPTATWPPIPGLDFVELQALSFTQVVKWSVILRGDATTFRYPELPVELASKAPQDLGSFLTGTRIIDAESIADYAAARAAISASVIDWPGQLDHHHQPLGAQVRGAGVRIDFK